MKSLYLILAATAVAVTSEPQRTNNDIIWYPVDDEEGVFISTVGEKHRTSQDSKWRSHRRARYSGSPLPLPLVYDPADNQDPSFFHNIHERRPLPFVLPIPKVPPAFQNQQFPVKRPGRKPHAPANPDFTENDFQQIIGEVFDYKRPPASEFPGTTNPSGSWSAMENQHQSGNGVQKPITSGNPQWGITSSSLQNGFPDRRPPTGSANQWGGPSARPHERPSGTKRPNKRPVKESDKLVFPDETERATTTPLDLIPTDPPTMSPCERKCPVTPQFNPVCGSDAVTYSNAGRLKCAQLCGKNVTLSHHGNCGRTPLVTPLVSNNRKRKNLRFL